MSWRRRLTAVALATAAVLVLQALAASDVLQVLVFLGVLLSVVVPGVWRDERTRRERER